MRPRWRLRRHSSTRSGAPLDVLGVPSLSAVAGEADAPLDAAPVPGSVPKPAPDHAEEIPGAVELVVVLLLLQAGFGLLSAIGMLVLALFTGGLLAYWWALPLAVGSPVLLLWCARGLRRRRRRARTWVLWYEGLVVLNAAVRLVFDREVALGLVVSVATIGVPLVVCGVLLSPAVRPVYARSPNGRRRWFGVVGRRRARGSGGRRSNVRGAGVTP